MDTIPIETDALLGNSDLKIIEPGRVLERNEKAEVPFFCPSPIQVIGIQRDSPIAWSGDGQLLAFVSGNHSIYLCALTDTVVVQRVLIGSSGFIQEMCFHPTKQILTACGAEGIYNWDLNSGDLMQHIPLERTHDRHEQEVLCLDYAFDGKVMITGSKDADLILWDSTGPQLTYLTTLHGHKAAVNYVSYCPAKNYFASAGRDSAIKIWDLKPTLRALKEGGGDSIAATSTYAHLLPNMYGHRGDVVTLTWNKEGTLLFSGARDSSIKMWDMVMFQEIRNIGRTGIQHKGDVRRLLLVNDDTQLISVGTDGLLNLWELAPVDESVARALAQVESENDSSTAFRAMLDSEEAADWRTETSTGTADKLLSSMRIHRGVGWLEECPTRPLFVSSAVEASIKIWIFEPKQYETLSMFQEFVGHDGAVNAVKLLSDEARFISGSHDTVFHLYEVSTVRRLNSYNFGMGVLSLAVSTDEKFVFAGGADYCIKAFPVNSDVKQENEDEKMDDNSCALFEGHSARILSLAVAPNNVLVSGGQDFALLFWDISKLKVGQNKARYECFHREEPHDGHILAVAFSNPEPAKGKKEGYYLASGSSDHRVVLWKVKNHSVSHKTEIEAHPSVVSTLCFGRGPTDDLLFTGGWDSEIKIWKIEEGSMFKSTQLILVDTISCHQGRITSICVDPSGKHLVSAGADDLLFSHTLVGESKFSSKCVYKLEHHLSSAVTAIDVGGDIILSGSDNGMITIWPLYGSNSKHTDSFLESSAFISKQSETDS